MNMSKHAVYMCGITKTTKYIFILKIKTISITMHIFNSAVTSKSAALFVQQTFDFRPDGCRVEKASLSNPTGWEPSWPERYHHMETLTNELSAYILVPILLF